LLGGKEQQQRKLACIPRRGIGTHFKVFSALKMVQYCTAREGSTVRFWGGRTAFLCWLCSYS
jgi:hypothetical protein